MNRSIRYHVFWNDASPLASLSGIALLIIASDRLAHALLVVGALFWVYCLSSLAAHAGTRIFPRRGRSALVAFLTSFIAGAYLLLLGLAAPLCVLELFFAIALIPMFCMMSGVFKRLESLSLSQVLQFSCAEALSQGILIIILALIREPLGFMTLSLPGGAQGVVLFSFNTETFLPVQTMVSASGALLLLGYCLGLYRYIRANHTPEDK